MAWEALLPRVFGLFPSDFPAAVECCFVSCTPDAMSARPVLDEQAIADACRTYGVRRLELFGSAVRDPVAANDFDFLVDLEEVEPGKYAKAYFGLLEALQKITGKPVDLVTDRSIKNPYFRISVDRSKRLVYAA